MKNRVRVSDQVACFVKSLAPEPRRHLNLAIKSLARGKGDVRRLEGKLAGFSRLRVSGHRVIFCETHSGGQRILDCIFAEKRAVVYELFLRLCAEELSE